MAKLFVCGDIVNQTSDDEIVGEKLTAIIHEADYSICNFEGPELKFGQQASCPHQKNGTVNLLNKAGFKMCLLANNHITELGADGVSYSINAIKEAGLDCIGAGLTWEDAYSPLIREIDGQSFSFVNVCEAQVGQFISPDQLYGYAWMGYDGLFDDVKRLAAETDYVIVLVHAGLEHYNLPIPEIRSLYRRICDAGASVVVGAHPHCAQGYEYYGERLIVYSLGNFFFPRRERWPNEVYSYSILLEFLKGEKVSVTPVFHHNDGSHVEITEERIVDVQALNEMLGDSYESRSKEIIQHAYAHLCERLLIEATCGQNPADGWREVLSKSLHYTLQRDKYIENTKKKRASLLKRLFENETYRWVIINALNNDELSD